MMTERNTTHGPGPDTKGGGFRGGPKRWTGRGPAPARHIPWPEVLTLNPNDYEAYKSSIRSSSTIFPLLKAISR